MIKVWQIWFASFPFEEDPSVTKNRPVIVLNVEPLEVLSVKLTTQRARDAYDVPLQHNEYAGLHKPSVARVSKTMILTPDKFIKLIGELHDEDKAAILEAYARYIEML